MVHWKGGGGVGVGVGGLGVLAQIKFKCVGVGVGGSGGVLGEGGAGWRRWFSSRRCLPIEISGLEEAQASKE